MDINNVNQQLIKGLEQKSTEQLVALSRVLNAIVGKTLVATVTSTDKITPQEREQLIKQTADALAALTKQMANSTTATPAVKADVSRLLEQQQLLQSPELKWVNLSINNKQILTYTNQPLTTGQSIPVQLATAQKLLLLSLPGEASLDADTDLSSQNTQILSSKLTQLYSATGATLTASLKTASQLNSSDNPAVLSQSNNTTLAAQKVSQQLRQLLPYKDLPNPLFSAVQAWQQLPPARRQLLASPSIEQALKSLAEKIRTPSELSNPKLLEKIIKNNGSLFEAKLAKNINESNSQTNGKSNSSEKLFTQDTKGALLNLLTKTTQGLSGNSAPLSADQTLKLVQQLASTVTLNTAGTNDANKKLAGANINELLQVLLTKPLKELANKELKNQLISLLQQHSAHSLAKLQVQQLSALNESLETKDTSQPKASWQLEIPVKHHQDIQHLHLRIDREWVDDQQNRNDNTPSQKIKQWSVTLRFDLPTLGEFCAQLAITQNRVSATLWASEEKTFSQVQQQLNGLRQQLEDEGIVVNQLQCVKGMPAPKPLALSYSLIDIST